MDQIWERIKLGKNDRGMLIGGTGSGKTFLGKYLVEDPDKPYSVTYDAKISESIGRWKNHEFIDDFQQLQESDARRIVYRPNIHEAADPMAQDAFFEWIYSRWHTRLFVDEAYAITGGTNPSFYFQACLTRGRERGISTLVATQRPHRIPLVTLSEAEHYYIFRLNLLKDRQRVEEITGISALDQTDLKEFEFFYYNILTGAYPTKLILRPSDIS